MPKQHQRRRCPGLGRRITRKGAWSGSAKTSAWREWLASLALVLALWPARAFCQAAAGQNPAQPAAALAASNSLGLLAVGQNADGRLELFRTDTEGALLHRWQKVPNGEWSSWANLGGACSPGLAVAADGEGRLVVVAIDKSQQALRCIRQQSPGSRLWGSWQALGERLQAPVTAALDREGRLLVFGVECGSGAVKYRWQTNSEGGWSAWQELGGCLEPGLAISRNLSGQLELFGVDALRGCLLHSWQRTPGRPEAWSAWDNLGGTLRAGLAVGRNVDGRLEVFAISSRDWGMQRIYQQFTTNGVHWSGWSGFGGELQPGVAVGQNADGRLEVFALNARHPDVMHRWQTRPNASEDWSQWWSLWGSVQPSPVVGRNQDGNLEVFGVDRTNPTQLNHRRQISANLDWLDWFSMDQPVFPYTSRTWQSEDGLPHDVVQAIAQTPDGYLWVGTPSGLARFDGQRFTTFDSRNTPALTNAFISALCVDRSGTLWVGTRQGLVRLRGGAFGCDPATAALARQSINVIYESRDGSLWIGTRNGLSRYSGGKLQRYTRQQGLLSDVIRAVFEDAQTNLWIGTAAGINLWSGQHFAAFSRTNGLPETSIRGITQDRGWRIWIGSDNGMIWYNTGHFYAYDRKYGLSDSFVSAVCEDHQGNLWVGTHSGLNRFREGRFFNELKSDGVPYDRVNTIFEDQEGNLWVGSNEGLIRLTPRRFFTYNKQQGLSHNNTVSLLEGRNGAIWTGTYGGGLNCLRDGQALAYGKTNGLSADFILGLCQGRGGSLWVGTAASGSLYQFKDGRFRHYTTADGLPDAAIQVLFEDRAGQLWLGTPQGLSAFQPGRVTTYSIKDHLAGNNVHALCPGPAGVLWVGTDQGLSRLEKGKFVNLTTRDGLSDNSITALHADSQGTLWVGTANGGLDWIPAGPVMAGAASGPGRPPRVFSCTTQQGLFSDQILAVLEDDYGWLWMSCPKGVFRVSRKELEALAAGRVTAVTSIAYGKSDGMAGTLCNGLAQPSAWKAHDGRLWFATTKGLVVVDPNIPINTKAPSVFIEEVLADKRLLSPSVGGSGIPAGRVLTLPPGRGELEFHFTAPNFQAPERTRFRYQLEGVDGEWVDPGSRRLAHYSNLAPGRYRFRVKACNSDGVWNEAGATLDLVLQPHLWQTWWFQGLALLGLVSGVGGAARYTTQKRLQRKLALLQHQHAIEQERGRIAKDIHDELGSSLTRIMMLGARAQADLTNPAELSTHVEKILSSARATVQSMDEIVWAVNPDNDSLDSLVGYLNQYVNQFFENSLVRCRLELPIQTSGLALPAELRHDLFLAVKEALHNVLKHAQATEVQVRVSQGPGVVEILIQDNGRGFDPAATRPGRKGHGLENMRKRMQAVGGEVQLESAPGDGTRLRFTLPLPAPKN